MFSGKQSPPGAQRPAKQTLNCKSARLRFRSVSSESAPVHITQNGRTVSLRIILPQTHRESKAIRRWLRIEHRHHHSLSQAYGLTWGTEHDCPSRHKAGITHRRQAVRIQRSGPDKRSNDLQPLVRIQLSVGQKYLSRVTGWVGWFVRLSYSR